MIVFLMQVHFITNFWTLVSISGIEMAALGWRPFFQELFTYLPAGHGRGRLQGGHPYN
jgi:hypothetical protein